MAEADGLPKEVAVEKETADFRGLPLVTIDGPDSKDLDDAVYCERRENGHFMLGVYIADVSRYVKKGMLLDEEAYRRGNSVYLADRVIPMLPFQLSNDLCSLNAGSDRYAMACLMDVSPEGKVTAERITPAVINVGRRCNYPEINKAFEEGLAPDDLKPFLPMLEALQKLTRILGTEVQVPDEPKPADLQKLLSSVKGQDIASAVEVMTLRSLSQACYSTENEGHYGIASECYTHFTSPIRRYSDLMVHRLIRQALFEKPKKSVLARQTAFLEKACAHCSETEQEAVETERDVNELKMTEYMEPFVGEPFDGVVTGVTRFGIFVGLDNGVEGLVRLDMLDEEFIYQEDTMTLRGALSGETYSLGMPVRVTLVRADKTKREVDFALGELHSPLSLEKKIRKSGSSRSSAKKKGKNGGGKAAPRTKKGKGKKGRR